MALRGSGGGTKREGVRKWGWAGRDNGRSKKVREMEYRRRKNRI